NTVENFLQVSEDPNTNGVFYGIDAPEFGTHSGGQLVSFTGNINTNAYYMRISYLTPRSTHTYADSPTNIPPDHTGFYRNPIRTTDGYMIVSHTPYAQYEGGGGSDTYLTSSYDFRLKILNFTNGYYVPGTFLTPGIVDPVIYWDPDNYVIQTNA